MPNIVLETNKSISIINKENLFYNGRGVFLHSAVLAEDAFFIRMTQKDGKIIIKLEKAVKPKITNSLKFYIFEFAQQIARQLSADIVHHNLNASKTTNHSLYEKYEITAQLINKTDWINSLCKHKDISVEIGMGAGEFLTDSAGKNKNECFLGIEVLNSDFHTALRRFYAADLDNVKAVYYDARSILNRFQPNSIKTVYINFPEPWFKIKKIKHSILTRKTVDEIEKLLRKDGVLVVTTDNYPYAVAAANMIEYSTALKKRNKHSIFISRENIKTKYEKKWIRYKRTIYRLEYEKETENSSSNPDGVSFPIKIKLDNCVNENYVFKILNIYKSDADKQIIEIAAGYNKNPQHIFFSLSKNNFIDLLPQSNFIVNKDFTEAVRLCSDK